ncbi:MAG: NADPH:quinone reductase [Parachlamydia sp.]|nr:NADPH:quinone reductase [Parachlamydia sp.]
MKAIIVESFGGPEVMVLKELPDPHPGPGQVVVSVKAAGVNPKDTHYRAGLYPLLHSPPFTPGIDGAGIIQATGAGVTRLTKGNRVFWTSSLTGSYAELALCDESRVHPLPEHISFAEGAGVGVPYSTAFRALFQRAKVSPGETILVHGASGGVGIAALQLARGYCYHLIGTAGAQQDLEMIKSEGADLAISHRDPGYMEAIIPLNGGKKVDVILEMNAHLNLGKDLPLLAKNGRVVVIGSLGMVAINPQYLKDSDAHILSVSLLIASPDELATLHAGLQIGLEKRIIQPRIYQQFALKDAAEAHHSLMQPGHWGKIVLIP